jgi:predicted Zn-dependent protease
MKYKAFIKRCILIIIIPLLSFSCEDGIDPSFFFSPQDDVSLGKQLDSTISVNPNEYPILNHTYTKNYVQNIVHEILKSPEIEFKDVFPYKVTIIKDDKTINAFATPGGYIYVYTGLLKFVDNEATLAAVLAHEIAHAERRHAAKRMIKQYGAQVLLSLLLGDNSSQLVEIGANLLTGLAFLANSRSDEFEADEYSFKYLKTSNWYPGGISYFFDKIKSNEGNSSLTKLLSTHPLPQDRIDAVKKMLTDNNISAPTESTIFSKKYSTFKSQIP